MGRAASRLPAALLRILPRYSMRTLATRPGEPYRSAAVPTLLQQLGRRRLAGPARAHRYRREDIAPHPRPPQGPQGPAHAERLRHHRKTDPGATRRVRSRNTGTLGFLPAPALYHRAFFETFSKNQAAS